MSVINVMEDPRGRTSGQTIEGRWGRRVFTVELDDPDTSDLSIRYATGLPRVTAAYPNDFWLRCRSNEITARITPTLIEVTAAYATLSNLKNDIYNWDGDGETENPLKKDPLIRWSSSISVEPIDVDIDGNPIINSSHEGFDPPVTREFYDEVLTITRNEAWYDRVNLMPYKGAVSSDSFYGFDAGWAKVTDITAEYVTLGEFTYAVVTYEIQIRYDGWKKRILDRGFRVYSGADGDGNPAYEQVRGTDGTPLTEPVLLDGSGGKLADGANPVWLEFEVYRTLPFAWLELQYSGV
jgi:hypothetical protein